MTLTIDFFQFQVETLELHCYGNKSNEIFIPKMAHMTREMGDKEFTVTHTRGHIEATLHHLFQ
jgi:hypothetical protein